MGIAALINKEKTTAFSFEVLPPLKGTGIEKLYALSLIHICIGMK